MSDPFETMFDDLQLTRPAPTSLHPELLEQLHFASNLLNEASPTSGPCLLFRDDNGAAQWFAIDDEMVIGRNTKAHLAMHMPEMSSRHFVLHLPAPRDAEIADLDSANGTFVNRERITTARPLNSGDVIEAGGRLFVYTCFDAG